MMGPRDASRCCSKPLPKMRSHLPVRVQHGVAGWAWLLVGLGAAWLCPRPLHAQDAPSDAEVARAAARLPGEPDVGWLLRHVLQRQARRGRRLQEALRRDRRAGLLPRLQLRARRGWGQDLSALFNSSSDRQNFSTDQNTSLDIAARFELSRLAFGRREVALAREQRLWRHARGALAKRVLTLYHERRRYLLERALEGGFSLRKRMRVQAIEAELDWLSGGAYRPALRRARRARRPHVTSERKRRSGGRSSRPQFRDRAAPSSKKPAASATGAEPASEATHGAAVSASSAQTSGASSK